MNDDLIYHWEPVVKSLLKRLKTAGFTFTAVDYLDGEIQKVSSVNSACLAISAVDECTLMLDNRHGESRGIYIVLGNGPHEIVCDYTCDKGIDLVVRLHEDQWLNKKTPTIERNVYYKEG